VEVRPRDRAIIGTCQVPGDKSISHRAALVAVMAAGRSVVRGFSPAGDCSATLHVLRALGAGVVRRGDDVQIDGAWPDGLGSSPPPLDCGRSGTTMRLTAGVLAGAPFRSVLTGDPQLLRRPMDRVAEPLRRMGARVQLSGEGRPPMVIQGGTLTGITYTLPVASAQVKSAVLLAGLRAFGQTIVVEPVPVRDHTERLLSWLGMPVRREIADGATRTILRAASLPAFDLTVPGDLSSAAPLLAAAALVPGSDLVVEGVGLNPTRAGFLRALEQMGAPVEVRETRGEGPEPRGDVRVRHAPLRGITVGAREVPSIIDELPLLGLVATQAEGVTQVHGAADLRVKESDRIAGLVSGLRALGAEAEELDDGFAVRGPTPLQGGRCDARADHRLAMTFAIAGIIGSGPVHVAGMGFVADSWPGFLELLEDLP
jgi:3-phosphoshikimate 1-carboxyvinyltransferase